MQKQLFSSVSLAVLVLLGVAGCTSFEEIKERADGGDPSMQYRAGLCYRDGKDVQADPDTAYSYFKKAADGGSFAGALCYAQEALRRKDISEPAKFLERIQKVFTEQPRNSEDRDARWEMRRDYPKFCIEFAILLKNADVGVELANFKNEALRFFSKKYLYRRHDVVGQYTAKLKAIRSKNEIAEERRRAEEKRVAEEKRRAEERRLAEERRAAEEKRRAEAAKAWAEEKRPRPGETRGQFKERVYDMLRAEADCPPLPGETPSEWRKRFEGRKNVQSGRRRQALTLDEAMAESRREIKRNEEKRAADQRYYAAKHAFDSKLAEEDRLAEEKRRAEEQRRAENRVNKAEALAKALIEKLENDPGTKYPYSEKIAGIELCNGYLSGLACSWVKTQEYLPDAKREIDRINHNYNLPSHRTRHDYSEAMNYYLKLIKSLKGLTKRISEEITHKGIKFYFDKQYGVLHSAGFNVKGDSVSVAQKIAEYKKKFPNLKHTRKAEKDEKTITRDDGRATIKWTIYTDTLESDRVKIVITSNVLDNLDVTFWNAEMSKLEKKKLSELLKTHVRKEYEETAEVVITDKAMKKYFESLKK